MFNGIRDYLFLRKISKRFRKPLRKLYSKRQTKYNLRMVRLIYKNLAKRYGITVKMVYNYLPLTIKVDPDMEGAYGLCESRLIKKRRFFRKVKVRVSTIFLNKNDVTSTTFIHEFGHYIRFLIAQVAIAKNKKAYEDFINITKLVKSQAELLMNRHDNFFMRGQFTTEEEENFAKSWEQYLKDGIAPDKKHKKLFNDFRKNIFEDMYKRNEKRKYEFYEHLEVRITPERKQFFDALIIGKRTKKESFIIKIMELYIYVGMVLIIGKLILESIKKFNL